MTLVFVYGSLREGLGNHRLLADSEFVDTHVTEPAYEMVSLGAFPAVIENGNDNIVGELYRVNGVTFSRLDMLEGYPDFYNRKLIDTPHGQAWMYYQETAPPHAEVVVGGDWVEYLIEGLANAAP